MGLPLFITPVEPEVTATVADKTAARARSAIRRQAIRVARPTSLRASSGETLARMRQRLQQDTAALDEFTTEIAEAEGVAAGAFLDLWSGGDRAHRPGPRRNRTARDGDVAPRVQPPGPPSLPEGIESTLMPPAPESGDFQNNQRLDQERSSDRRIRLVRLFEQRTNLRRLARQHAADRQSENQNGGASDALSPRMAAFSTHFSPANYHLPTESGPSSRLERPTTQPDNPWTQDVDIFLDLPPLRRVPRRTAAEFDSRHRRLRIPRLDGLGDRDRSLSPDGDGSWDTLLTSITPDPQPPSIVSSFASSTPSISSSALASTVSNPASSATSLGATAGIDDTSFENACDIIDEGSDTDAEDEEDIYELHDDAHAARDTFWRSYADVVAARADRVARHSGIPESDALGGMQRIVRRLARREDIPDEWWAEAGLSRTIPREGTN